MPEQTYSQLLLWIRKTTARLDAMEQIIKENFSISKQDLASRIEVKNKVLPPLEGAQTNESTLADLLAHALKSE
jgi:ribosome-binding protein aMBF1 (putative translation factor)